MAQIKLTATAVAFLSTDLSAQRLAIAWPLLTEECGDRLDADRFVLWAQAAGVPTVVAEKTGAVLLRHGLLLEDGLLADETVSVLNGLAARKLKELRK